VNNVVTYVNAKFGDDGLWNEKVLADRKSDNHNIKRNNNKKNKNKIRGHWDPFPGPEMSVNDFSSWIMYSLYCNLLHIPQNINTRE